MVSKRLVLLCAARLFASGAADETCSAEGGCAEGSTEQLFELHMKQGTELFRQHRVWDGMKDLVAAQRLDVNSEKPVTVLQSYQNSLDGTEAPLHLKKAVEKGIEQLERVLYEALYYQGELDDEGLELRLAKLHMLYYDAPDVNASAKDLQMSVDLLEKLEGKDDKVPGCKRVAESLAAMAKMRQDLVAELRSGKVTAEALAKRLLPQPPFKSVERKEGLSVKEYVSDYLSKGRPVVVPNYDGKLFGGEAWSWEQVREACGDMEVSVAERNMQAKHLWAGLSPGSRKLPFSEWLDDVASGSAPKEEYLMDWGMAGADRCKKFTDAFYVPKYFTDDLWKSLAFDKAGAEDFFKRHPSIFVGRGGSGGAMHVDSYSSTFWQVLLKGRKRWTLYAMPDELRRTLLYAGVEHEIMPHIPGADEEPHNGRLPLLDVAEQFKVVVEVGPGDLMIVPFDVPHMVENLEDVMAISMNVLDRPALPRFRSELQSRGCFSDDAAIDANLRLVSSEPPEQDLEAEDMPYSKFSTYAPRA